MPLEQDIPYCNVCEKEIPYRISENTGMIFPLENTGTILPNA